MFVGIHFVMILSGLSRWPLGRFAPPGEPLFLGREVSVGQR
jgi:hypothetical protein